MVSNLCYALAITSLLIGTPTSQGAIFNMDPRYGLWNKLFPADPYVRIPVYVESSKYASDPTTLSNIRAALQQMNSDLFRCINFVEITTPFGVGFDFVWISPSYNNNTVSPTCASVPGRTVTQNQQGQKLMIVGGGLPGTCGTSVRQIMGKLANTLGERNEYQRSDRPITVNTNNIAASLSQFSSSMYATYSNSIITAYPGNPNFDYNSITMIPATTNAAPGTNMYTTPGGQFAGTLSRLSAVDCAGISWRYGCSITCQDPYTATSGATATITTPTTTTTTAQSALQPLEDF